MAIRARRGMLDILIHFSVYTEHIKIHNRGLSPIITFDGHVAGGHHHVAAATVPVPAEGEGLLGAIDLALDLGPGQRRIGSNIGSEAILVIFRPAAVHTGIRDRGIAAGSETEAFVGLVALLHV